MLPTLAYPELKKYKHCVGHYGGAWYEQKVVCILLTLLHLGIRNIRLGPTLASAEGHEALIIRSKERTAYSALRPVRLTQSRAVPAV